MVRLFSPFAQIAVCHKGRGRVLIDGRVVDWGPGKALLCPRHVMHAFEAEYAEPWHIAWVFYDDSKGPPLVRGDTARLVDANISPFVGTLRLLTREASGEADPAALQSLVSLLKIHTMRLGDGTSIDERLVRLWGVVESNLGRDWSFVSLARAAGMSSEHLRRLCARDYGCTPMKRVLELRLHRACVLLRESSAKIEVISEQLGFSSVYYFSAAFKEWSGLPPGRFRSKPR
jgi:AraC-like DNA-binding protein